MDPASEGATDGVGGEGGGELAVVLAAASRGDEGAWRRLIELFGRRVFALVKSRGVSADVAEEITQSVFATVAAKLPSGGYMEFGKFEAWIFRIAMNRVRDESRRRARHAGSVDSGHLNEMAVRSTGSGDGVPGTQLGAGEKREQKERELVRLRVALGELTDADREVVQLRHHGGLSFKQIAVMLDEPLGTLLARHHRALKKLASLLGGGAEEAVS